MTPARDKEGSAPRRPDRSLDGQAPVDVRLERAMRMLRGATVRGVKLSARAWANHPSIRGMAHRSNMIGHW